MAAEMPVRRSVVVESRPSALEQSCREILSALEAGGFSQDDIFAVHLALEEAFLNAVKHGNRMDPTKKVQIDYTVNQEKVEISMTDEGPGFDPGRVPDPRVGKNLYRPEGRGLLLIRSYMHTVEYNERGNSLRMVRRKNQSVPRCGKAAT
ncbi:MAG: ATP-binding protein [Phycisphaerae bacterium]|nr:ATP-binding protein [Phycisphaerae bacterium]